MSGYRWRGHTARNAAARQWADAQWEHGQRSHAQSSRQVRAAAEASSPAADAARTWQTQAIAATIRHTVTVTAAQGATP